MMKLILVTNRQLCTLTQLLIGDIHKWYYMIKSAISSSALQAQKRAIAKTIGYRLFMLLITVTVAWVIVGDIGDALNIGLITNVLKTGTYYLYERMWDHITWGISTSA